MNPRPFTYKANALPLSYTGGDNFTPWSFTIFFYFFLRDSYFFYFFIFIFVILLIFVCQITMKSIHQLCYPIWWFAVFRFINFILQWTHKKPHLLPNLSALSPSHAHTKCPVSTSTVNSYLKRNFTVQQALPSLNSQQNKNPNSRKPFTSTKPSNTPKTSPVPTITLNTTLHKNDTSPKAHSSQIQNRTKNLWAKGPHGSRIFSGMSRSTSLLPPESTIYLPSPTLMNLKSPLKSSSYSKGVPSIATLMIRFM